jgi:predicted nucleic acid-binding protein
VALILGTNALSAAADREPAALKVVAHAQQIAVPVIVLGEYRLGIAQSRWRASYEKWVRGWIAAVIVLDVDEETTRHYASTGLGVETNRQANSRPMIFGS